MRIKWFSFVRIAGLISVLTYHFFKDLLPGGFVGVDIFFTFSGFLITALMIDEFVKTDGFNLLAFYRRRFYRIVPPLILMVLVVVPLTYLVSPDYITGLGRQITAAIGFTTNYFEIATGGSYESKFIPHLFVHTWSLAVEMHFYLLWGLLVAIMAVFMRRVSASNRQQSFRWAIGIISLVLAFTSSFLMVKNSAGLSDYSKVYFSSLSHCFPFFIGAVLASLTGIKNVTWPFAQLLRRANKWVIIPALILVFGSLTYLGLTLQFDNRETYVWGILVASILAALAILLTRCLNDATPYALEPRWVTFIADTSYGMYLYHWPLFVIFSKLMNAPMAVGLTILVGLPCSALSYYVIEPYISGKSLDWRVGQGSRRVFKGSFVSVAVVLLGVAIARSIEAPTMTNLESRLWLGGLKQSADQVNTDKNLILAANADKTDANQVPEGVSIIGDSVTLGTRDYLGEHVKNSTIDAKGERTMDIAHQVMMTAQDNGTLRQDVVICIGTNALSDTNSQLKQIIHDLNPGHRLILMTPYDQRAKSTWYSYQLAKFERELPRNYEYITVADWQKTAEKHPDVFKGTDGVHFSGRHSGDVIYAQTINHGLKVAERTPLKGQ